MSRSKNPEAYIQSVMAACLFHGMGEAQVRAHLKREQLFVRHFAHNELIYTTDGFAKSIGLLLLGSAVVTKQTGGSPMIMSVLQSGDLFGAAALFSGEMSYVASIRAQGSTWTLFIPEQVFRQMLREDFLLTENYLRYLTARIRFLSARIDGFTQPSVEDRVEAFLREHAVDGVYTPQLGYSALAETMCVGRTTLYRALEKLQAENKIVKDGRIIRLSEGEQE